jgi:hypothetical protein
LTRKECVEFLVGGWDGWGRGRRRQRDVVHRELDVAGCPFEGGLGACVCYVPYYGIRTCFSVYNAKARACADAQSEGNVVGGM